uniref:Solute carrier family 25 member 32 n=1 Tax=Ornithorhynchus anatinus TaxID=9258 RepID=A0A6I8NT35_ORNAN
MRRSRPGRLPGAGPRKGVWRGGGPDARPPSGPPPSPAHLSAGPAWSRGRSHRDSGSAPSPSSCRGASPRGRRRGASGPAAGSDVSPAVSAEEKTTTEEEEEEEKKKKGGRRRRPRAGPGLGPSPCVRATRGAASPPRAEGLPPGPGPGRRHGAPRRPRRPPRAHGGPRPGPAAQDRPLPPCALRDLGGRRQRRGPLQPGAAPARPRQGPLRSYNAIKSYKTEGKATQLEATEYLVSAAEAGAMTLCLTNPLWVTKTRLMLQYEGDVNSKRQYKGMLDTLVKIYKNEGVRGLYKGFVPGLFGTSHGALQFMAYELLKLEYNKHMKRLPEAQLSTLEYISVAALSKIFAVAATYPYQVVRARLQDQHNLYEGVMDVISRTWRKEGVHGFYKGIVPNLIRVTPACCITFVVYENVSHFLLGFREE